MTIRIEVAAPVVSAEPRSVFKAMCRGGAQTCPACGEGRLFAGYLKVVATCAVCRQELFHQRADDAPPYFTMLIVGHVVIGGVLALERSMAPSTTTHLAIWLPLTLVMSLVLLPSVKGALKNPKLWK